MERLWSVARTQTEIEQRLIALEAEIRLLKSQSNKADPKWCCLTLDGSRRIRDLMKSSAWVARTGNRFVRSLKRRIAESSKIPIVCPDFKLKSEQVIKE